LNDIARFGFDRWPNNGFVARGGRLIWSMKRLFSEFANTFGLKSLGGGTIDRIIHVEFAGGLPQVAGTRRWLA
jgi:hypothetical protein